MDNGIPLLKCSALRKKYSENRYVLDGLDLTLERGRIAGLLGPNGSGKTTLIKLIAGLLTPNHGSIEIDGIPAGQRTKAIVSYLPDKPALSERMRIEELVEFYSDFFADFETERAHDMLSALKIEGNPVFRTLSKGTKDKVQLILTMSRRASLYLLDEPIGGVDPAAREYILNTILSNYDRNASVLISTHLITDVEKILDDAFFISGGKIIMSSSVENIRNDTGKTVDELFREMYRC